MKSKNAIRTALILLTSSAVFTQISYSQTLEVDPVAPIPGTHTSVFATEWNTATVTESWTANSQYTLTAGTPTGGLLTGTQGGAVLDPSLTRTGINFLSSSDTIIEFRITKNALDTSRIDLFWADDAGGIGGPRVVSVPGASVPTDGLPHTYRFTFSGQIYGKINTFRLDPSADAIGQGKATSIDYIRVYTSGSPLAALTWDPAATAGVTPGGPGTWDTSTNLWWNGASQVAWPAPPAGDEAIFSGLTAGAVSVPAGITAKYLTFGTTGYSLTGTGPLTLADPSVLRNTAVPHITTIDVPLAGGTTQTYSTGTFVINKAGIQTGTTRLYNGTTGFTVDNPFGASSNKVIVGSGGNAFISSLGAGTERVIANNVDLVTNRLVINNGDLGTLLPVLPLNITGNVFLNMASPGDIYLRRNLKIGGIVSGTGFTAGLYFAGDVNTMTLSNTANTFTNGIRWDNNSTLEVAADGSMGAAANNLRFNLGTTGTLRLLSAFNSARPIVITNNVAGAAGANNTTGRIDTNGFDSIWSGTITGAAFATPATAQQNTNFTKIGAGTLTLDSGGVTVNNLRSGGIRADGGTLKIASGAITTGSATANGVAGGCFLEVNGGSLTSGNFAVGKSAGLATFTLNTGGTYINNLEFLVAFNLGDGVVNINGGTADLNNFSMVDKDGLTSTINLNGGSVRLNFFNARFNVASPAAAVSNINFNGSTVFAKNNHLDFIETNTTTTINALVQAGGAIFNTTNPVTLVSNSITIKQPLLHDPALGATLDGGLTKNGLGTLTLAPTTGSNTYSGPTTVNAGILAVNGSSLDDLGKFDIVGGKVSIPAATNETVNTLFFNGVQQAAGVYGSSASGAAPAFQNDTYFDVAGTGTLTVTSGPGGASFASWAAAFTSPTLSPSGPTADADFDGLSNAVEYVLGGDPRVSSQAERPTSTTAAGVITFTFNRVDSSETPDVTTVVQVSTDLVDWTTLPSYTVGADTASSTAGVVVAENGAVADGITVTIPNTGAAKKFARLTVVTTP